MDRPEASMLRSAQETSGHEIRWCFLHRATIIADHEDDGFAGMMFVIASKI
jgi:hypothetical protein